MRQSRPPPQDQSTAMNAATPSIQDFVDRTHLVERRLRTGDTMRCLDCGQALPTPTGGYRAAIRCGCRVWLPSRAPFVSSDHQRSGVTPALPVTITGWYSSAGIVGAWTTLGAVQCGVVPNAAECRAYQRHLTQQEQRRTEMAHGAAAAERYERPAFPHTDDPHLLEQRRQSSRAFTSALQSGTITTTEDMDRIQRCLGCGWAIQQQAKRAKPGYHVSPPGSAGRTQSVSRDTLHQAKGAPCASTDTPARLV